MKREHALAWFLPLALIGGALAWEDLTPQDWLYTLATRVAKLDGRDVHYPTPTVELARLLETRKESAALRQLAEAKLALGDRAGALAAMERWAAIEGPEAWAETARWAADHRDMAAAFRAAERALPGLTPESRRALSDTRIHWADRHPELADPIALRGARAAAFPEDARVLEDWIRALERANRLPEADQALQGAKALSPERRLLFRSELLAAHNDHAGALRALDAAVMEPWTKPFHKAFAQRVAKASPGAPAQWRNTLETRFDADALVRLATLFQGQERGGPVVDLLHQVERRHVAALGRSEQRLLARLYAEVDAIPEAFRATLAAAHGAPPEAQQTDLAALAHLALKAGGRPVAIGTYNDEPYRWAASIDRTPGFWTGAISFLLTNFDAGGALAQLESTSLPDRTFTTARALAEELTRRAPQHPDLPALRLALMERHVERGEGEAALKFLPQLEASSQALADAARRAALLALRQVERPVAEELRLMQARLRHHAPDGSRPSLRDANDYQPQSVDSEEQPTEDGGSPDAPEPVSAPSKESYRRILEESIHRLEQRDAKHLGSLKLILAEMDRLPNAEELWLHLADRLEQWKLDDELGPRYEGALARFQGQGVWGKLARWYAHRSRHAELRTLADRIAQSFRGSALFSHADAGQVNVEIPDQPKVGGRIRLVAWADWIRLRALERFPQSPKVFHAAQHRLMSASRWAQVRPDDLHPERVNTVVAPDALLETRRWALLFVDTGERENWFQHEMARGNLEARLQSLEAQATRNPMEDLLLFEGWSRLSRFERAAAAADRLALSYPGDGALAQRVLSLHRSLNGLDGRHAEPAHALVARTAPALENPIPLWTELGELEEDRGRPDQAMAVWKPIVTRDPRNPERISELATLLWDYNHDREALTVVEEGRKRIGQPHYFAFETGVLRENLKDLDGAVQEYLAALNPGGGSDQRALRRMGQLLGRARIFRIIEQRIQGLQPGKPEDERALEGFFPLATLDIGEPVEGADDWMDIEAMPNDTEGRAQKAEAREAARPQERTALQRMGDLLLEKAAAMAPRASREAFLDSTENWIQQLMESRWKKDRSIQFRNQLLARRAELCPDESERARQEVARADYLVANGLVAEADTVWSGLESRISKLPEGVARIQAEVQRAGYLERAKGPSAAAQAWRALGERHPWNLGVLEDRLAFLERSGSARESRDLLEAAAAKAAPGHREPLLERLTRETLAASELPRARKAVEQLLGSTTLEPGQRLGALHLLARLSLKEKPDWNPLTLAKAEEPRLPDHLADLYQVLAQAADLEDAHASALALWIEALNRRTDRTWLQAACRSAALGGRSAELLGFFERQLARSPRDVRWAVAVRDIRRALHQVEGAITAAKAAVAVRPEREELWREAVQLLVLADRPQEAADYLEGWNRPRLADENVARWRAGLYARAGNPARALAVEQAALQAFAREYKDKPDELNERKARALDRLFQLGLPDQALRIYDPKGNVLALEGSRVPAFERARLALLTNQFRPLMDAWIRDPQAWPQAASALQNGGRPEQREECLNLLMERLHPTGKAPDASALNTWWPFLTQAGLEAPARLALAQRHVATRTGPWQTVTPLPFLEAVGTRMVERQSNYFSFGTPDLPYLWMRDLARRDRPEELMAFIEPRWQELVAQVRTGQPVSHGSQLPWSAWMSDGAILGAWARAAAAQPAKVQELTLLMGDRAHWDRFWALAARAWDVTPLLQILPPQARTTWYRYWEASPPPQDPVLVARHREVDGVILALERLLQGSPNATADPLIQRLRGPRTVGDVLGKDTRWLWPVFTPRKNAKGELMEQGDDRITGGGADTGRLPGSLWGERPGEAWYVLEALARFREGDASAALVPLEVPRRGNETERIILALRLAKSLGNLPLALELDAEHPGASQNRRWMETRLALLMAAGRKPQATEAFRTYLQERQAKLTEESYRDLGSLADALGLPAPMELLDAAAPVGPAFLAYLTDQGQAAAKRFHTADPASFRLALANRWREREEQLNAEQIRHWLREFWATGIAPIPNRGLRTLGGLWPQARPWLDRQPVRERLAALEAVTEADTGTVAEPRLFAVLVAQPEDSSKLLAVRMHLRKQQADKALALLDRMLSENQGRRSLTYAAVSYTAPSEGEDPATEEAMRSLPADGTISRLRAWLKTFREGGQGPAAEARLRRVLATLRKDGALSMAAWKFTFELSLTEERTALLAELEAAWFRGEIDPALLWSLCETLAEQAPAETPRWLARWPRTQAANQARIAAKIQARLKDAGGATQSLMASRTRNTWSMYDETAAFDLWRNLSQLAKPAAPKPSEKPASGPRVPATWLTARSFWTAKVETPLAPLAAHLKAHPFDGLAARAALRSLGGEDWDALLRIQATLNLTRANDAGSDALVLNLRATRGQLPTSWRAARGAFQAPAPAALARTLTSRRFKTSEVHAVLADLARIAQRAEDGVQVKAILALLSERKAPGLKALRDELAASAPPPLDTFRRVNGRPTAIRPRDLTWGMLSALLKPEVSR